MSNQRVTDQAHLPRIDLRELATILIRHHGLHTGRYQVAVGFSVGIGPMPPGANGTWPLPGAMVAVEGVQLTTVDESAVTADIVDASVVNPAPTAQPSIPTPNIP